MKIWKDGDEGRAICPTCERRTSVVYRRRTIKLEAPDVEVSMVLVAVCQECDGIAAIPHQSTPKLRAGIERPTETLNVRVPGHLEDVLGLLADRWAPGARSGMAASLRILLHRFGNDPSFARHVKGFLDDPLVRGTADHDLSVRVPAHILIAVDDMAEIVGIPSRSDVTRCALAAAKEDVLDNHDPVFARALETALTAVP
jgi:hypothetical protein